MDNLSRSFIVGGIIILITNKLGIGVMVIGLVLIVNGILDMIDFKIGHIDILKKYKKEMK